MVFIIRSSEYFTFAGKRSKDYGIINVNISGGMQEEPFVAEKEILEIETRGRDKPYFQGIKRKPLQFTVSFAFEDYWDKEKIRAVARWLTNHDYYQPLIFSDDNERIFYAMFVDEPQVIHNCLQQGYIELSVRCNSPYSYSPIFTKKYVWNEVPKDVFDENMDQGELKNLQTDDNGRLIINPVKRRWINFSSGMKWSDLNDL